MVSAKKQTTRVAIGAASALIVGIVVIAVVFYVTKEDKDKAEQGDVSADTSLERALRALDRMPIIDGHNDFPYNLRRLVYNDLSKVDFNSDLTLVEPWGSDNHSHTDIPRLKEGRVGAQFWAAYTSCSSQYKDSVEQTIEQIDVIRRFVAKYSDHLQWATSAADIEAAIANKKIASLIGVEGGHSIQASFGILRVLYNMGTRYMTLTHSCNTPWADSSPVDGNGEGTLEAQSGGLSDFGLKIIDEMNRLGMMVDISHVSNATMKAALIHSKAPVIFSHSSAKALCDHHRNVPDEILDLVKDTKSLVMVNFYSKFIVCEQGRNATLADVVEHINHIKIRTSADNVGIGADYDGVTEVPQGLEDVSKYPDLFAALLESGEWTEAELEKLAGRNLLRVLRAVEQLRDNMRSQHPHEESLTEEEWARYKVDKSCITAKFPESQPVAESTTERQ